MNGTAVVKPNHTIRIGDTIAVPQGVFRHIVRVLALGQRRGPAREARLMYEETANPVRLSELAPEWTPLLMGEEPLNDLR